VSLTGDAPRLWATPLFYALFPDDGARAWGQWAVGTVAWALLAGVLWGCLRTVWVRVFAAAATLGLALLPQVTNWDFAILSESLSISLGIAVLALLVWWLRTRLTATLVALTSTAAFWTFVRPDVVIMVGPLVVMLAVLAWRDKARRWAAAISAVVLIASLGWVLAITPKVSRTFAGWSATGLSLNEETLTARLRHQVLPDPAVKAVFRDELGMPECAEADRIAAGHEWRTAEFGAAYRGCAELKAWGEANATSSGYRFALAAPGLYACRTWNVFPASLAGTSVTKVSTLVPGVLQKAVFPHREAVLPVLFAWFALVVVGARAARRQRMLVLTALGLVAACAAGVLFGLMYSAGSYARFGIQEAIGMRVALLIGTVAVLDTLAAGFRVRQWGVSRRRPAEAASADALDL
jgi:hypothetical protein